MSEVKITVRKNSVGSPCCRLRVARNLSQSELGQRCGMTLRQISRFERTGQGQLKNVRKIADVLDVTLDGLLRDLFDDQPEHDTCCPCLAEKSYITGVEYYRRKRRMKQKELSQITGVSVCAIDAWGKDAAALESAYVSRLLKLADALGVTMDQLCAAYPTCRLKAGDKPVRGSAQECPTNCITVYRRCKNLTFDALAQRMGLTTREAARINCIRREPREEYIRALAEYEQIPVVEFLELYCPKGYF